MNKMLLIGVTALFIVGCSKPAPTPDEVLVHEKVMLNKAKIQYSNHQYELAMDTLNERWAYIRKYGESECHKKYKFGTVRRKQCYNYWSEIKSKDHKGSFWMKAFTARNKEAAKARR